MSTDNVTLPAGEPYPHYRQGNFIYAESCVVEIKVTAFSESTGETRTFFLRRGQGQMLPFRAAYFHLESNATNPARIIVNSEGFIDNSGATATATGSLSSTAPHTTTSGNEVVSIPANSVRREILITNKTAETVTVRENGAPTGAGIPLTAGASLQIEVPHLIEVLVPTSGGVISWVEVVS